MLLECCIQYVSKYGKQQWPKDWKRSIFNPIPKKDKEGSNYCTTALISHASKVMLKIIQDRLQWCINWECSDVQARLNFQNPLSHRKKQEHFRKTSTFDSLTTLKPLILWTKINWKILKTMGIPDHLTCLLKNLYTDQETMVRTRNGTVDCFQIGKGECQNCTLSQCLFNIYMQITSCEMPGWLKHNL